MVKIRNIIIVVCNITLISSCSVSRDVRSSKSFDTAEYIRLLKSENYAVVKSFEEIEAYLHFVDTSTVCQAKIEKLKDDTIVSHTFQNCWIYDVNDSLPDKLDKFKATSDIYKLLILNSENSIIKFHLAINEFNVEIPLNTKLDTLSSIKAFSLDSVFSISKSPTITSNYETYVLDTAYTGENGDNVVVIDIISGKPSDMHFANKKVWISSHFGIVKSKSYLNGKFTGEYYLKEIVIYKKSKKSYQLNTRYNYSFGQ